MEFKYKLDVKVTVEADGGEVQESYDECGESHVCDDIEEYVDMFLGPRFRAAEFVLTRRIKNKLV